MCKGPEARSPSEHGWNSQEDTMPGEGPVREQGAEDGVGEASGRGQVTLKSVPYSVRQKRKH